ncbi:alpha/beta hydrolase [Oxalobacteraceae bacterium CAVE-383]|nr:alpha/beta hydrolase [Oxalobacteraceae bacterium CAVE-383]
MKHLMPYLRQLFLMCSIFLFLNDAVAARVLEESTISIKGEERRYFHLYDSEPALDGPIILIMSGSGCNDFGSYFSKFFTKFLSPINVYLLEKPGINKGVREPDNKCSKEFNAADQLDRRVEDNLEFLKTEATLRKRAKHSVAVLGFSEGGPVALQVASKSEKIGWLAVGGSGGLPQSEEFLIFADRGVQPYASLYSRDYFLKTYIDIKQNKNSLEKEFFGHPYKYWASHLFFDPLPVYAGLDIPIVVAMGEKDESVPIESGRILHEYFLEHPEKNFQFIEFKNANHGLYTEKRDGVLEFVAGLQAWFKGDPQAFNQEQ